MDGAEEIMAEVPATWTSAIVLAADRAHFLEKPERVLINGGYFDGQGQPDALLIDAASRRGRLRHDGLIQRLRLGGCGRPGAYCSHRRSSGRRSMGHRIRSCPGGKGTERNQWQWTSSSSLGDRPHARPDGHHPHRQHHPQGSRVAALASAGIDMAINLDGGPSSALEARILRDSIERPGVAKVPYFVGFIPRSP